MTKNLDSENIELSISQVGEITCAININQIQEINKHLIFTKVHDAPQFVRGILNLRGQIITVIDLGVKFGFKRKVLNEDMRVIVVKYENENIGLLVEKIVDVVIAEKKNMERPPSNISGVAGEFFAKIYKMDNHLAAILNIDELLKVEKAKS